MNHSATIVSLNHGVKFQVSHEYAAYDIDSDSHNPLLFSFLEMVKTSAVIIDVGAHVGLYTILAAKAAHRDASIHAIDASMSNLQILQQHLDLNEITGCHLHHYSVGDHLDPTGIIEFSGIYSDRSGWYGIEGSDIPHRKVQVPGITLDQFCRQFSVKPDLIKIDIEGAEFHALHGASMLLSQVRPVIFLSLHPELLVSNGQSIQEMQSFLENAGYDVFDVDEKKTKLSVGTEYRLQPRA